MSESLYPDRQPRKALSGTAHPQQRKDYICVAAASRHDVMWCINCLGAGATGQAGVESERKEARWTRPRSGNVVWAERYLGHAWVQLGSFKDVIYKLSSEGGIKPAAVGSDRTAGSDSGNGVVIAAVIAAAHGPNHVSIKAKVSVVFQVTTDIQTADAQCGPSSYGSLLSPRICISDDKRGKDAKRQKSRSRMTGLTVKATIIFCIWIAGAKGTEIGATHIQMKVKGHGDQQ
ncbi:hypothetical protein EI94DRAFT_1702003 [Lactarius quietus]|nr:hypothetical protein EI94DRAFT_1702003 [Lactarius quietus]